MTLRFSKTAMCSAVFALGTAISAPVWADPDAKPAAEAAVEAALPAKTAATPDKLDKVIDAYVKSVQDDKQLSDTDREKILGLITAQRVDPDLRTTTITDALATTNAEFQASLMAL